MSTIRQGNRVLLAEDDDEMRKLIRQALEHRGYEITECPNGYELFARLIALVKSEKPLTYDLVISDIRMPGWTGLEVIEGIHKEQRCPPIILITAFGDKETHAQAQNLGVTAVFDKPFEIESLLNKVHEITTPPSNFDEKHHAPSPESHIKTVKYPIEIVYRQNILNTDQNKKIIHNNAAKLNSLCEHIDACRVIADIPHHHHHRGNLYHIEVILWVSGQELVADHTSNDDSEQNNMYTAVRHAFDAAERQLKDYIEKHQKP